MTSDFDEDFKKHGFLSTTVRNLIPNYRADSTEWFQLADDLNEVLQLIAVECTEVCHGTSFERDTVAAFLLMRGLQTYQGSIIVSERGMVVEARILVRSLLEDTFCAAGLLDHPEDLLQIIRDDHDASRKGRAKVILDNGVTGVDARKLNELVSQIQKVNYFSPEKAAKLGPLQKQYLLYKQISDDAAHPTANSIKRHMLVHPNKEGWSYRWGPDDKAAVDATLNAAILCALPLGVAVTEMLALGSLNAKLGALSDRFTALAFPAENP